MIGIRVWIALLAGVALAALYVAWAGRGRTGNRAFAAGLVVAAVVYVGFAIARGTGQQLLLESIGVVLFATLAFLGVRRSAHFLALGWLFHAGWDIALHPVAATSYAPWWYPVVCITFDVVVAAAIWRGLRRSSRP